MRFFVAFIAIFLASVASADEGFVLRSVNTWKVYDFGRQYAAIVYRLEIPRNDFVVQSIEGTNDVGMTNDKVNALHIVHQNVRYLPRRVLDWYKNINHYHVVESRLEVLEGEPLDARIRYVHFDGNLIRMIPKTFFRDTHDMELISMERNYIESLDVNMFKEMTKLRWVSFAGNRIRTLPGTLFVANPNLECISFERNGLRRVGSELVSGLDKLKGVSFDGNVCINSAYFKGDNIRDALTREFTTFCGGKCDGVQNSQNQIAQLEDAIMKMEEKAPKCSQLKHFSLRKDVFNSHDSSSSSSESNEQENEKYGPGNPCPHAHYNPMKKQ